MTTAVYLRTSSDIQADKNGVESQRFTIRCMFAARGWDYTAAREYVDEGISGTTEERPAFQQLRSDIQSGGIRHLVVYELDRLARDVDIRSAFVRLCMECGCKITDASGDVDTSSPVGLLMERIRSALAEYQRAQIAERTSAGIRSRISKGHKWGGARVGVGQPGGSPFSEEDQRKIAQEPGTPHAVAVKYGINRRTVKKFRERFRPALP